MSYLLQTHHLTKAIAGKTLVNDVELHLTQGEIYGFLGPNGAGKTTVMRLICGLWYPTSGSVELFGKPLAPGAHALRRRMGSVIEFPAFYGHLTGRENLELHREYMGYHRPGCVEEALAQLELSGAADRPVSGYSLGMKQRLGIARAMLCRPELLILDEPTNGLDPAGIREIRQLLRSLRQDWGVTILVSSHILSEVENLADRVGILHRGELRREVTMDEVAGSGLHYLELTVSDEVRTARLLEDTLHLTGFRLVDPGRFRIYDPGLNPGELTRTLSLQGVSVTSVTTRSETLEDYFLKLTGEEGESC